MLPSFVLLLNALFVLFAHSFDSHSASFKAAAVSLAGAAHLDAVLLVRYDLGAHSGK